MHEKTEKYSCETCGKELQDKYTFKAHISAVHNKVKNPCDICGKEFANLKQHISLVHEKMKKNKNINSILIRKLKAECDICGKELTAGRIKRHVKEIHKKS